MIVSFEQMMEKAKHGEPIGCLQLNDPVKEKRVLTLLLTVPRLFSF